MRNPEHITEEYCQNNFKDCGVIIFENPVKACEAQCLKYLPNLQKLVFKNTVEELGPELALGQSNLSEVIFEENVISINRAAFAQCRNLKNVIFHKNVENVEEYAFANCSIENLNINKMRNIGQLAFASNNFKELSITSGIIIDKFAFSDNLIKNLFINVPEDEIKKFHLHSSIFQRMDIDKVYYSAPTFHLEIFMDSTITNLYLDLSKIHRYFTPNHPALRSNVKIDNIFTSGEINPEYEYPEKIDNFLRKYCKNFRTDLDSLIDENTSLSERNKHFKSIHQETHR